MLVFAFAVLVLTAWTTLAMETTSPSRNGTSDKGFPVTPFVALGAKFASPYTSTCVCPTSNMCVLGGSWAVVRATVTETNYVSPVVLCDNGKRIPWIFFQQRSFRTAMCATANCLVYNSFLSFKLKCLNGYAQFYAVDASGSYYDDTNYYTEDVTPTSVQPISGAAIKTPLRCKPRIESGVLKYSIVSQLSVTA
jgi:hypothetical protein